ncbi:uncharacterized protein LOC110645621 isoform X1 [Hevea brasiliensis]|uniref:uncharacterized protein LOC110645621 isoform X1 n=1 Tax=Hevea brasiliensis TaxID=3981 RepID=UPI0025DE820E|nr:uncharacterized protein LOC110645621 isoform X1 [Hevea brasiliensis]
MNSIARHLSFFFGSQGVNSLSRELQAYQIQQWRGIRVKVFNGNLEHALTVMQRKMQSSGIERLIKREQLHHIKNSEKRVLARKNLQRKIKSQEYCRKLKALLMKKVRVQGFLAIFSACSFGSLHGFVINMQFTLLSVNFL